METNFFTRQLTEYRVWPTGDKGCLFYVADARIGDEKTDKEQPDELARRIGKSFGKR